MRLGGAALASLVLASACSGGGFNAAHAKADLQSRAAIFNSGRFDVTYELRASSGQPDTDLTVRLIWDGLDHTKVETQGVLSGRQIMSPPLTLIESSGEGPVVCSSDAATLGVTADRAGGVCVTGSKANNAADVIELMVSAPMLPVAGSSVEADLTISGTTSRTIAGRRARCFDAGSIAAEWCFGDDGTLAFARTADERGQTIQIEAKSYGPTPTDADFAPPYPVVQQQ
jgi:hypothetical protein